MRVYLSGPMTGLPDLNFPAFNAAAAALRAKGFVVVNPTEINAEHPGQWESCMKADIKALCDCDALAMLPGWERSNGAHLEVHIAHRLGMQILPLADLDEAAQPAVAAEEAQALREARDSDEFERLRRQAAQFADSCGFSKQARRQGA